MRLLTNPQTLSKSCALRPSVSSAGKGGAPGAVAAVAGGILAPPRARGLAFLPKLLCGPFDRDPASSPYGAFELRFLLPG